MRIILVIQSDEISSSRDVVAAINKTAKIYAQEIKDSNTSESFYEIAGTTHIQPPGRFLDESMIKKITWKVVCDD
ncbi:MAG: hypothetical protein ACRC80_08555 [Waterburya sp.]